MKTLMVIIAMLMGASAFGQPKRLTCIDYSKDAMDPIKDMFFKPGLVDTVPITLVFVDTWVTEPNKDYYYFVKTYLLYSHGYGIMPALDYVDKERYMHIAQGTNYKPFMMIQEYEIFRGTY